MKRLSRRGRTLVGAVVMAMIAGAAVLGLAAPAAAAQVIYDSNNLVSWSYTDSEAKSTSFTPRESNVPVGAWLDAEGERHNGTATVSFTPSYSGFNEIYVYALDGNGVQVGNATSYYFSANDTAP